MNPIGAILVMMAAVASAQHSPQNPAPALQIDHFILEIDDLDAGIAEFERLTGVKPERGGEHPGRGTQNALVSLGEGRYLEILAPLPSARKPAAIPFTSLTPSGWALRTSDLDALVASLKAAGFLVVGPTPGSRRRPDGSLLEWQTVSATGNGLDLAPFFIRWSPTSSHPSTTSPAGCTLERFEASAPDADRLRHLFEAIGYNAILRTGEAGMWLTLRCAKGEVFFGR